MRRFRGGGLALSAAMSANLYAPRYWPTWVGLAVIRSLALLPFPVIRISGGLLGGALYHLLRERRRIAAINLRICFPGQDADWHRRVLREHFRSLGIGILEVPLAWWGSQRRIQALGRIRGLEHLHRAQAEGRGVILLAAHFTSMEVTARCLLAETDFHVMYRRSGNPVLERVISRQRHKWTGKAIPRDAIRDMIRSLRAGHTVWYAPDQNSSRKQGVFARFFGEWASTSSATARLSRMTGARVVPFKGVRRADGKGYEIVLEPALADYPSGDLLEDTQRINDLIQRWVSETPAQYLWIHRRFRTRPAKTDPSPYRRQETAE